jgi:hypothetical protein
MLSNASTCHGLRLTPMAERVIITVTGWETLQGCVPAYIDFAMDDTG